MLTGMIFFILIFGGPFVIENCMVSNTEINFVSEEIQEIEKFEILQCLNDTLLTGVGGGNSTEFAMSINTENIFVFYTADNERIIERKEIPFDFKIKEEDRNNAELVLYQKNITENICKSFILSNDDKKCAEETRSESQYYVLYVPLGTFDGSINLN